MKLNADWVVLSACNTIAGEKPGAEALSGLARSFFYAGARALLVTHWAVDSAAATRLTTATFDRLKADPKLGRAEALRQAMLAYLGDTSSPAQRLPRFLGPVRPDRRGRDSVESCHCASQHDARSHHGATLRRVVLRSKKVPRRGKSLRDIKRPARINQI